MINKFKYTLNENGIKETRLYFLILGLIFPFTEIFTEFFKIRNESEFIANTLMGVIFISFYLLSKNNTFIRNNINFIFKTLFLLYTVYLIYKSVFFSFELISFSELLVVVFFSYAIFNEIKYFLLFNLTCFAIFLGLLLLNNLEFSIAYTYLNAILVTTSLSLVKQLVMKQTKEKLLFSDSIVQNGNSLIIATSENGYVSFCSNNITKILGYDSDEVMGMGFWKLTEDIEFEPIDYANKFVKDKSYLRKLKCKNGQFRFIEWQDIKFSETLYVGIGEDVSEKINIENNYKNLIHNANDIIYKTDATGNFIFINEPAKKILGYNIEQLIGKHFTSIIGKDYIESVSDYYINNLNKNIPYETLEFPVQSKDSKTIWVSQNVTVERDMDNNPVSFSGIVRDITAIKQAETEKIDKLHKADKLNLIIKDLTLKSTTKSDTIDTILEDIIKKAALGLNSDKVSVWTHSKDKIECSKLYNLNENTFNKGLVLYRQDYPKYFNALYIGSTIIANNICENEFTKEFCNNPGYLINSLVDVPIFVNGEISGLICCEMINSSRNWDAEETSFIRSIADIVSISFETQKSRRLEQKLLFRSQVLAAIADTTHKLIVSENIAETLNDSFAIIGKATNVDKIYFFEQKNDKYDLKASWYNQNCAQVTNSFKLWPDIKNFLENNIFSASTCEIDNLELKNFYTASGVLSILILPIYVKNTIYAYIGFEDYQQERIWSVDQINAIQTLVSNISNAIERKNDELKIVESESNFRLLNETIADVFWLFDIDLNKFIYISPSSELVLGIDSNEIYKSQDKWINTILDVDKESYFEARKKILTEGFYEAEYRIKVNNKTKWIYEKSFGIKNENGNYSKASGFCTEITEKKKIEFELKQLSLVAEKTSNGITIADIEGRIIWANQSYLNMFEIPFDKLVGNKPRLLFNKDDTELHQELNSLNQANTSYSIEFEAKTYLKKPIWIELNTTLIVNSKGEPVQVEIINDISERKKHEENIKKYSLELEFQNTFKERLINATTIVEITNEALNSILSGIKDCVYSELLILDEKKELLNSYIIQNSILIKDSKKVKDIKGYELLKNGQNIILPDLKKSKDLSEAEINLVELGVASYIYLPIFNLDELLGIICIGFNCIFKLTKNEVNNIQSLTALLASALSQMILKNALFEKDSDHIASLRYAKNIQNTILPTITSFGPKIKDINIFFKPRDIVSGDFYWSKDTEDYTFIAVADCTGHGVPGAFLTLIGSRILDQIIMVEKYESPSEILTKLDDQVFKSLNINSENFVRDGMEIALCAINKKTNVLTFAGAGLSLFTFTENDILTIKGQRKAIGDYRQDGFSFENHSISIKEDELFFMVSDGYHDQLGGDNYKRFSKNKMIDLLNQIKHMPASNRNEELEKALNAHIKHYNQTDDITVLGFKINNLN